MACVFRPRICPLLVDASLFSLRILLDLAIFPFLVWQPFVWPIYVISYLPLGKKERKERERKERKDVRNPKLTVSFLMRASPAKIDRRRRKIDKSR